MRVKDVMKVIFIIIGILVIINLIFVIIKKNENKSISDTNKINNSESNNELNQVQNIEENKYIVEENEIKDSFEQIVFNQMLKFDNILTVTGDAQFNSVKYSKMGKYESIIGLYDGDLTVNDLSDVKDEKYTLKYMIIDNFEQYNEIYKFIKSQLNEEEKIKIKNMITEDFFKNNTFVIIDDYYLNSLDYSMSIESVKADDKGNVTVNMKVLNTIEVIYSDFYKYEEEANIVYSKGSLTFIKLENKNIKNVAVNVYREIKKIIDTNTQLM